MATGNTHKKLVRFGSVVFELCERTNEQTNKQTDILIAILGAPSGSEVINAKYVQFTGSFTNRL